MIQRALLWTIINDQFSEVGRANHMVNRDLYTEALDYAGSSALVIKGARRCGKSTLLKQIIRDKFQDDFFYFSFDDERLIKFGTEDFQALIETFIEKFGSRRSVFLDEIQNVKGWELFISRLLREGYRVFITGSNSNLLSKELGTHLTGRHIDLELYPFSFKEFLRSKKIEVLDPGKHTTTERSVISGAFREYFSKGGMPEVVTTGNDAILLQYTSDIIQRDIIGRHEIRKPQELKSIARFLIANASNEITFRSISHNLNMASEKTVKQYVEYLEDTYLVFQVERFSRKLKTVDKSPRKIYCIDNGIILKNAPDYRNNHGAILENIVALQLKRRGKDFYYYRHDSGAEVDFIIPSEHEMIQVCYEIQPDNAAREIRGFRKAMTDIKADKFIILTMDQEETIEQDGLKIEILPAWKWLIES